MSIFDPEKSDMLFGEINNYTDNSKMFDTEIAEPVALNVNNTVSNGLNESPSQKVPTESDEKNPEDSDYIKDLKAFLNTDDCKNAAAQVKALMRRIISNSCEKTGKKSVYDDSMFFNFIASVLYLSFKYSKVDESLKPALYDFALTRAGVNVRFTGEHLFSLPVAERDEINYGLFSSVLGLVDFGAFVLADPYGYMDFSKAVASFVLLIGDDLKKNTICNDLGVIGACYVMDEAIKEAKRFIEEHRPY